MLKQFAGSETRKPESGSPVRRRAAVLAVVIVMVAVSASAGLAQTSGHAELSFLRTEYLILGAGASGSWHGSSVRTGLAFDQFGGDGLSDEFSAGSGKQKQDDRDQGPSHTGDKIKAGLFSALVPGTGQFYNGQNTKGYIMVGAEVAIWTAYLVFDSQGDSRMESAREWAGIYAGTSGEHNNSYWQNVGGFMDSDAYNESRLREARALEEEPSGLVAPRDAWQWVNEDRRDGYSGLRADGNSAYDRRDFMILFAVVNRAISVVDAVLNAGGEDGVLETEVLGMNMELEMLPSFSDPGGRWVVSRSF